MTEAYGYYLNNTSDRYDYIGNPSLKNESAIEVNTYYQLSILNSHLSIGLDANAFFFSNYIIGQFETRLSPMTIGAKGVKVYGNISHATIANTSLTAEWQLTGHVHWNGRISYSMGRDADGDPLPLVSPVSWQTELQYDRQRLQVQATVKGNTRQSSYGAKYGETPASEWAVVNLSAQYQLSIRHSTFIIRGGIENLLDKQYATYADWNHIPQKGRNIYVNLTFAL